MPSRGWPTLYGAVASAACLWWAARRSGSGEIRESSPGYVEWRFVNTKVARDDRYYRSSRDWAEVTVVWSSTPLPHKVSRHFEDGGGIRVTVSRRGVAALADGVREHVERLSTGRPASDGG